MTCPWATAEHKGVKPFLSAASTCASAASSNLTQSINGPNQRMSQQDQVAKTTRGWSLLKGWHQPFFWTTHHTLGDWNKSSGRSLQATPTVLAILLPKWRIWLIRESLRASLPTGNRDKYDSHSGDVHKPHRPQATHRSVLF